MSEVLSSVLLVGITVAMMMGAGAVFLSFPAPLDATHADLQVSLEPGTASWGDGDEAVAVRHRGGEALPRDKTTIRITVGGDGTVHAGAALGDAFSDGMLRVGETWRGILRIPPNTPVRVSVASDAGIVAATILQARVPCNADAEPPTVGTWTQAPADVTASTTGAVSVTVLVLDDCSGVDGATAPRLYHRIQDGSNPPFVDAGPMAPLGGDQWVGSVPDPGWTAQATKSLEYYVSPMRDKNGNVGGSANRSDVVQVVGTQTYVASATATTGTVAGFASAQSAADGGAEANLTEANTAGHNLTDTLAYAGVAAAGTGWSGTTNVAASDDVRATNANNAPGNATWRLGDVAGDPGLILKVVLRAELSIQSYSNDAFTLAACLEGGPCSARSGNLGGSSTDVVVGYDVTALRPGGGPWTWADVNALLLDVQPVVLGVRDGTWRVDRVFAEVTYTVTDYALSVQMDFAGVPSGSVHSLELRYRVDPGTDTFRVQAWNGTAWTTRGLQLTATTPTDWVYLLTAAEWNGGAPRIRFLDDAPTGAAQGVLRLDFARVVTS